MENNKLLVIVDERERELYDEMSQKWSSSPFFTISKQVLIMGDILIKREQEDKPLIMIERKCISDLLASIKDGRYKEQSARLLHASGVEPHNIVYLIEGVMTHIQEPHRQRVYSAMTSVMYLKRMSVLRTWSVQESAELIARMADKIAREGSKGVQTTESIVPTTMTGVRKSNITQDNIGEILLVQIPGISSVTARAILDTFNNSFTQVIQGIETNDPRLADIKYRTADGKMRRISKGILQTLRELFIAPV